MNDDNVPAEAGALAEDGVAKSDEREVFPEIVALIKANQGVKTWPSPLAKEAEALLTKALAGDSARLEDVSSLIGLVQELPVGAVEAAVAGGWTSLRPEFKEKMVSELLKYNSKRGLPRQVAVAEKLARMDQQAAARLLDSFVTGGKTVRSDSPQTKLSDEKRGMLQSRFLLSEEGWVFFDVPDEQVMKTLLIAFIETATHPQAIRNKTGSRSLYDFTRWAISVQQRLEFDEALGQEIRGRIRALANELPEVWKKEIHTFVNDLVGEDVAPLAQVMTQDEHHSTDDVNHGSKTSDAQKQSRNPTEMAATSSLTQPTTPPSRPLLKERLPDDVEPASVLVMSLQDGITRRRTLIDSLQEETNAWQESLTLAKRLAASLARLERDKVAFELELETARKRIRGLQSESATQQDKLSLMQEEIDKVRAVAESRGEQLETVCKDLERERMERANERRELEEDAGRMVEVKLNGFKWKLGQSLRPVFDNKRSTDDQEPSPRLAEFLRHWFDELETHLNAAGVTLGQDI